jgi:hypothetical protein
MLKLEPLRPRRGRAHTMKQTRAAATPSANGAHYFQLGATPQEILNRFGEG